MFLKVLRIACASALLATLLITFPGIKATAGSCWSWGTKEKKLARRTNGARQNHGKAPLTLDPELSKVAKVHSREMAKRNKLYHTPGETLAKRVTRWRRLGENVAYGSRVKQMHRMFMRSSTHRDNILGRYRHFGIGIKRSGGRLWTTVVFSSRRNPGTTLSMPC